MAIKASTPAASVKFKVKLGIGNTFLLQSPLKRRALCLYAVAAGAQRGCIGMQN